MWRRIGPQHPPKLFGSCTIKDMNKNAKEINNKTKKRRKKRKFKKHTHMKFIIYTRFDIGDREGNWVLVACALLQCHTLHESKIGFCFCAELIDSNVRFVCCTYSEWLGFIFNFDLLRYFLIHVLKVRLKEEIFKVFTIEIVFDWTFSTIFHLKSKLITIDLDARPVESDCTNKRLWSTLVPADLDLECYWKMEIRLQDFWLI